MTGADESQDGVRLTESFPSASQADWWVLVEASLSGSRNDLYYTTADTIEIAPIYGPSNDDWPAIGGKATPAASRPLVAEASSQAANQAIASEVAGGARQIALQLATPGLPGLSWKPGAIAKALAGVDLDAVEIHLRPGLNGLGAARELLSLVAAKKLHFGLGADPIGAAAVAGAEPNQQILGDLAELVCQHLPRPGRGLGFLASGVTSHEAGGSPALELAFALACAVAYLRALEQAGLPPQDASALIAFEHTADTDIFKTIAKFRSSHHLWQQVLQASGVTGAATCLEARVSARMLCANDVHTNMIRATTAALGASIGGAGAITVLPFTHPLGQPDDVARRIARNTPVILAEESHIGTVGDAAAGSHYVEYLTQALTSRAWEVFREIEAAGGISAMLTSREFQSRVAQVHAAREGEIARGNRRLTGVNIFPHLDEHPPEATPWPDTPESAGEITPLTPIRLDAPFARLRQQSDAYLAKTGARPTVFVVALGGRADFATRAAWCTGLLASAGIETKTSQGSDTGEAAATAFDKSGCEIVCICGSNEHFTTLAVAAVRALKQAGAKFVALAGDGGSARAALIAAGVDTFVHPGDDTLAFVTKIHGLIGAGQCKT